MKKAAVLWSDILPNKQVAHRLLAATCWALLRWANRSSTLIGSAWVSAAGGSQLGAQGGPAPLVFPQKRWRGCTFVSVLSDQLLIGCEGGDEDGEF